MVIIGKIWERTTGGTSGNNGDWDTLADTGFCETPLSSLASLASLAMPMTYADEILALELIFKEMPLFLAAISSCGGDASPGPSASCSRWLEVGP